MLTGTDDEPVTILQRSLSSATGANTRAQVFAWMVAISGFAAIFT
jgi:hypothetical protein